MGATSAGLVAKGSIDVYKSAYICVCKRKSMRTNIDINDKLIQRALEISHLKTKKAVVELALQEYIDRQARQRLLSLFGKVEWDGDLNQIRTDSTPNDWDQ